jgi:IS30 family transposase
VQESGDRRAWSPEQIAARLKLDFSDDESMRIIHGVIYQALYNIQRCAQARTHPVSSHRSCIAGTAGPLETNGVGASDSRGPPQ